MYLLKKVCEGLFVDFTQIFGLFYCRYSFFAEFRVYCKFD
jgi:hypothetical protein